MCKVQYFVYWAHKRKGKPCPNLVNKANPDGVPATVWDDNLHPKIHYPSLLHVWNGFYQDYVKVNFPRIIIRFEDMLLYPDQVLKEIANCVGVDVAKIIKFQAQSSKTHGSQSSWLKTLEKTGNDTDRIVGFTPEDKEYAAQHLDKELLEIFHYSKHTLL